MDELKVDFENMSHASFLSWAISFKDIQEAFKQNTGKDINSLSNRSGIEMMIDEATGYAKDVVASFIVWVTENYWAEPEECKHIEAYVKAKNDLLKCV